MYAGKGENKHAGDASWIRFKRERGCPWFGNKRIGPTRFG
jgi:hypothetical protein